MYDASDEECHMVWSSLKKKLETEYLAESLKGRISYFMTSYRQSGVYDLHNRVAIILDGVEVFKTNDTEYTAIWRKYYAEGIEDYKQIDLDTFKEGAFEQGDFLKAIKKFDCQSIDENLVDENAIIRALSLLDRRVGKRRLVALREHIQSEPMWIQMLYLIRIDAEKINPPT